MSNAEVFAAPDSGDPPDELCQNAAVASAGWLAALRRAIFELFNSGAGAPLSAFVIDVHFLKWRLRHPGDRFSHYYAGSIANELKRGKTHKTLGDKRFLSGSMLSNAEVLQAGENRRRGAHYFDLAVANGLLPHHRCVDVGCGSLRVGQHLIGYLGRGNYWGLDIVSDFYEAGKGLMPPGVLEAKAPELRVIGAESLAAANRAVPDYVVSFAVLKHVPPKELDAYFDTIAALMSAGTTALITFNLAERTSRTGAKIWDFCGADVLASARSRCEGFMPEILPPRSASQFGLPRTAVLRIAKAPGSPRSSGGHVAGRQLTTA
jgi:SAM-dependent methyltransferase